MNFGSPACLAATLMLTVAAARMLVDQSIDGQDLIKRQISQLVDQAKFAGKPDERARRLD